MRESGPPTWDRVKTLVADALERDPEDRAQFLDDACGNDLALRARVEAACTDGIRHRAREHADPMSSKAAPAKSDPEPPPPEAEQFLLEFKERHYADWLDHSLPALDGMTPRKAARTVPGRSAVDTLLKDMENREQRSAGGSAFDFSKFRRELGLDED
jgi:hypothetical protein